MKKSLRYLIALFIIFSLNFFIPRIMPGDPVTNLLGEDYVITEESLAEIRAELGLDRPLAVQYVSYWKDIFLLDMGHSYHLHEKVSRVILSRMRWTLSLVGIAVLLGAIIGTFLGGLSGWGKDSWKNRTATFSFLAIYSMPPFFLALLCLYFFAFKLQLFPMQGFYDTGSFLDILHHAFLPVMVMSWYLAARYFLIMRGSVIQERGKHYVLYARAKGAQGRGILYHHVFKNASLPIITLLALDLGFSISGALFVEIIFSLNGMGTLIFDALMYRDYPVLQGAFLAITLMVISANFLVDILYPKIDPRVRERE